MSVSWPCVLPHRGPSVTPRPEAALTAAPLSIRPVCSPLMRHSPFESESLNNAWDAIIGDYGCLPRHPRISKRTASFRISLFNNLAAERLYRRRHREVMGHPRAHSSSVTVKRQSVTEGDGPDRHRRAGAATISIMMWGKEGGGRGQFLRPLDTSPTW